jgi:hypothetical protein
MLRPCRKSFVPAECGREPISCDFDPAKVLEAREKTIATSSLPAGAPHSRSRQQRDSKPVATARQATPAHLQG